MAVSIRVHRIHDLDETRRDTFHLTLAFVAVSTWLAVLIDGLYLRPLSEETLTLWFIVETLCAVTYALSTRYFQWSLSVWIVGAWLCNALAAIWLQSTFFLYLFSVISLITGVLLQQRSALAVTLLTSVWIVTRWGMADGTTALLLMWFTLMTGMVVSRGLYQALQIALDYEDYAVSQMQDAREHRGQLMMLTKALQEARYDLEMANTQLRHARDAAEEARRLKAQFAANVSHELRTPINLIVGFSEMMVTAPLSYGASLPPAYWVDINTIYRNAKHLQGLINDILDVSQIEAGRMAVVKEEADPRQVILEAADMIRDTIANKGLIFNVSVPDQLPCIWVDRIRIRQVILNLLGNAIRFTDAGAITLAASVQDNHLLISVADTGIGIRQEDLSRVFEEFHQLEGSLSRRYGGSGLGLALSKQFVELHHGWLEAESPGIGEGSVFRIMLPLAGSSAASALSSKSLPDQLWDEARYFVVLDDDPTIVQLFERYAEKHRAIGVQSAEEARHLLDTIHPTALVLDENQPYDDVKALAEQQAIPLIECPMPSGRRSMKAYGVTDYLVKPISSEALQDTLRRLDKPVQSIVVIDDDQDMVRLYDRMLRALSPAYQIRKAYSALEGLEIMKRTPPDALILDLLMPEVDGFAVIREMKTSPALADVPIILASAYGAADAIVPNVKGRLSVFRADGFQPIELVQCVERLVDVLTPASGPVR